MEEHFLMSLRGSYSALRCGLKRRKADSRVFPNSEKMSVAAPPSIANSSQVGDRDMTVYNDTED